MSYTPVYRDIWRHEDLEGAPFEEKGFFIYLWSNEFIRPSGIYRASDEMLAAGSNLPLKRVQAYLYDLQLRLRIVRDRHWLFVRGYLARQPKHTNLLRGVKKDIDSCSSILILESFSAKYPLYSQWSADRRAQVAQPMNEVRPSELELELESELELEKRGCDESESGLTAPTLTTPIFRIPISITTALERCPKLSIVVRLQQPAFWQAELRANPGVDFDRELLKAEAYLTANPTRGPRKDLGRFIHNWLSRADRPEAL